jgi:hypothetical protein
MINTSTATCRFSCFCSAQFHDDVGRVLERDRLATVGQRDRVLEWSAPALRHEFYRLLAAKDRPKAVHNHFRNAPEKISGSLPLCLPLPPPRRHAD